MKKTIAFAGLGLMLSMLIVSCSSTHRCEAYDGYSPSDTTEIPDIPADQQ